jgi:hypothetical protein
MFPNRQSHALPDSEDATPQTLESDLEAMDQPIPHDGA